MTEVRGPVFWAGIEVVAKGVLGEYGVGTVLAALLRDAGRTVPLGRFPRRRNPSDREFLHPRGVPSRMARLRGALSDCGLGGLIQTRSREGYTIERSDAERVIAFLEAHA